uniref:Uncharacterized protein n=1 Tax=Nannospalax galili TaxID=1026970 RepID=A0A8C6R4X6_NANGA
KMDPKDPNLLSNEPSAICALKAIPRELFAPLFNAAFKSGNKNTFTAMVEIWPFTSLHIGTLSVQEPQRELLKSMVVSLPLLPTHDSALWSYKLRVLNLRQDAGCKTVCPEISSNSPICFYSCAYSEHAILKIEIQYSIENSESESQSSRQPMELLVDISLDSTLRDREFLSLLVSKEEQSLGSLHFRCRDLQIDKLSNCKSTLRLLNLKFVDHLAVDQVSLSEVTPLFSQVAHLARLSLSKITCRFLNGNRMVNLKVLNLSLFCLTNHLRNLLRILPSGLNFLCRPFCELSYNDFKFLSLHPHASHLKRLNLSNNSMDWKDFEPFHNLLEKVSGTLQHLAINHSTVQFHVLSVTCNPITMSTLIRILQHLTPLTELKYVIYAIPVHCYGRWHFQGSLDQDKLADVQSQLKTMLQMAQRSDMNWVTLSD